MHQEVDVCVCMCVCVCIRVINSSDVYFNGGQNAKPNQIKLWKMHILKKCRDCYIYLDFYFFANNMFVLFVDVHPFFVFFVCFFCLFVIVNP